MKVDPPRRRILAIGGNVRGAVGLKLLPRADSPDGGLRPLPTRRRIFAPLKLRTTPTNDALYHTPTIRAVHCDDYPLPLPTAGARLVGRAAGC